MNLMMPYRPFHCQSRVECIKKKFENSFSEENEKGLLKYPNSTIPYKLKVLQELRDLNLNKNNAKKCNLKDETDLELNDISKTEGKILIKRTPAFRREKLGSGKSLTHFTCKKSTDTPDDILRRESQQETQNVRPQDEFLVKADGAECNSTDIKRSKTDTNLLRNCTDRHNNRTLCRSPSNPKVCDLLGKDQGRKDWSEANCQSLPEYSVVNKSKNKTEITQREVGNLKFSDSIRRALQSPLPKGPPPKKPPRTFCHIPQTENKNKDSACNDNGDSSGTATKSKADIPKLKSKLEKLEKAIQIHKTGTSLESEDIEIGESSLLEKNKSSTADAKTTGQSCSLFSSCISQGLFDTKTLSKPQSEFYFDLKRQESDAGGSETNKESCSGPCKEASLKTGSAEAIYDLPFVNKKNHFETFGKGKKESGFSKKTEGGLHYLCTDVVKRAPTYPKYFSNFDRRMSLDGGKPLAASGQFASNSTARRGDDEDEDDGGGDREASAGPGITKSKDEGKNLKVTNSSGTTLEPALISSTTAKNSPGSSDDGARLEEDVSNETESGKTTGPPGTSKRKFHPSHVKSKLINQAPYWKCKNTDGQSHLFEYCLLVGLTLGESKQNVPYIKSIFPPDMKPPPLIESLCFPDASYWPPNSEDQQPEEQYYSLVVTNENGERKFGYCRRVLPEGGHFCLPLTYCIISPHRAGGFFYKVLEELESRHGSPGLERFIRQLYESQFPGPGERLKLKEILEEAARITPPTSDQYISSTLVRRPCDVRLEEKGLTQMLHHLQPSVFLKVFSSLLHERKVLLLSNSLRKLSSCTEALQSVLLPFSWQHTFIPVLPVHLIEMCEAPTPYVIGLLRPKNVEKPLTNVNFEDGILVDLDESKIIKCCGDEGSILPQRFARDLKTSLNSAINATDLTDSVRNVLLSDAFIRFFVQVCGNYSKFIRNLSNGERIFQKDEFLKSVTSNATHSFLEWFAETAMFTSFIQERLQGDEEDTHVKLFRFRAMEYSGESVKDFAALLKNYRGINKKARTLSDKIKDFTSFTR